MSIPVPDTKKKVLRNVHVHPNVHSKGGYKMKTEYTLEEIMQEYKNKIQSVVIETIDEDTYVRRFIIFPTKMISYPFISVIHKEKLFPISYKDILEQQTKEPEATFYVSITDIMSSLKEYIHKELNNDITRISLTIEPELPFYNPRISDEKLLLTKYTIANEYEG